MLEFTKTKPDFACVFVSKRLCSGYNEYAVWQFAWELGEAPEDASDDDTLYFYLAWLDQDGDEWDDIAECDFDAYLVLDTLPTMDAVHEEMIATRRKRETARMTALPQLESHVGNGR